MAVTIRAFTQELLGVIPENLSVNPYGANLRFPTVGSRGIPGTGEPSTDVMQKLQKLAIEFAGAYRQPDSSFEIVNTLANSVEGALMMEETLSIISRQKADRLLTELQTLMEEKYDTEHNRS